MSTGQYINFKLNNEETEVTALKPKNVIKTYLNHEKRSKENNYVFFQKQTTCFDRDALN